MSGVLTKVTVLPLPLTISGCSVSVSDGLSDRTFFFRIVLDGWHSEKRTALSDFPFDQTDQANVLSSHLLLDLFLGFRTALARLGLVSKDRLGRSGLCRHRGSGRGFRFGSRRAFASRLGRLPELFSNRRSAGSFKGIRRRLVLPFRQWSCQSYRSRYRTPRDRCNCLAVSVSRWVGGTELGPKGGRETPEFISTGFVVRFLIAGLH